jgi:hypothetical protein
MISRREVSSYSIDIFVSTTADFGRTIRLNLLGPEPNTVYLRFGGTAPVNFLVNMGDFSWTVHLPYSYYEDTLHLLQTERPVYFTAYELPGQVRFAGLTTDDEHTGEGFRDADLPAG